MLSAHSRCGRRTPASGERSRMETIIFKVPGPPQGKGRPRTGRNKSTGKPVSYTPAQTVLYENWIRTCYMQETNMLFSNNELLGIDIMAFFPIPKSTPKKIRAAMMAGEIRPLKKPDGDNILKAACDALNGLAYRDDRQLADKGIHKWYENEEHGSGLEITITMG